MSGEPTTAAERLRNAASFGAYAPGYSLDRIDADLGAIKAEGRAAEMDRSGPVITELHRALTAEKAKVARLREALAECMDPYCWECGNTVSDGHEADCSMGRVLAETADTAEAAA